MSLKLNEIQDLIRFVSKSGVCEVQLELEKFKIIIRTEPKKKRDNGHRDEYLPVNTQIPLAQVVQQQPQLVTMEPAVRPQNKDDKAEPAKPAGAESNHITLRSPMIGTFYRSASPDKPPFVNVGDEIKKGQVICIIEAMKLFNEIEAEHAGRIVKVVAADASPVEYDQPMFLIEPI